MAIGHADSADDRSDDSNKTLVCAAEEDIFEMGRPIELFLGSTVNRTIVMPSKTPDGFGSEDVGVDHIATENRA